MKTRCDFCGALFAPEAFGSRTCDACKALGAPDQSVLGYDRKLPAFQRKMRNLRRVPEPERSGRPLRTLRRRERTPGRG